MVSAKKVIGYGVALLIPIGVIATLLAVLVQPYGEEVVTPTETHQETTTSTEIPKETTTIKNGELSVRMTLSDIPVVGTRSEAGTAMFHGFPFGQPPVGEYRWQNPRDPLHLSPSKDKDYFDASYARPACPQLCTLPSPEYVCPQEMSEDCLTTVVYMPSRLTKKVETAESSHYELIDNIKNAKLPVMFYIYGGAYISGGNAVPLYDGRFIAEKGDVIIVVPNYRLGPFGFFYQDDTTSDSALGNFGIWDQMLAMKWVQNNIEYFGGDPNSVTLYGQSAGAQSIAVHLVNDNSNDLFHQAILHSMPFGMNYKNVTEAQAIGGHFIDYCECKESFNKMACLRRLSMQEVLDCLETFPVIYQYNSESFSQLFEPWSPVIDNKLLDEHPFYTFEKNNIQKPLIMGYTTDEAMFFLLQISPSPAPPALYNLYVTMAFGADYFDLVEDVYPHECRFPNIPENCDERYVLDDLATDYMFTCPTRYVHNLHKPKNLWTYTFDQQWSFPQFWENYTLCYDLSCHSADLPYLFDMDTLTEFAFTEAESLLADKMIKYWTEFARFGNPNGQTTNVRARNYNDRVLESVETEYWPAMFEDETITKTMLFTDNGEKPLEDYSKLNCDFLDTLDLYLKDDVKIEIETGMEIDLLNFLANKETGFKHRKINIVH